MTWVMFFLVVAIVIKSFEMAKSLLSIEQRLQTIEQRLGERGGSPLSTYAGLDGRLDNLQRQVTLMAEEMARENDAQRRSSRLGDPDRIDD